MGRGGGQRWLYWFMCAGDCVIRIWWEELESCYISRGGLVRLTGIYTYKVHGFFYNFFHSTSSSSFSHGCGTQHRHMRNRKTPSQPLEAPNIFYTDLNTQITSLIKHQPRTTRHDDTSSTDASLAIPVPSAVPVYPSFLPSPFLSPTPVIEITQAAQDRHQLQLYYQSMIHPSKLSFKSLFQVCECGRRALKLENREPVRINVANDFRTEISH